MKLRQFNSEQLKQFIDSGEYAGFNILPITRQRAYSQIKNPHLTSEDILLIIAFNDVNEIIGFCGMMPGKINLGDSKRIFWNSCWWVDPAKGGNSSMSLFFNMLKNSRQNMIFADMTQHTFNLLGKTGFFNQPEMPKGIRGYYRFCLADILPPKLPVLKKVKFLLRIGDSFLNLLFVPLFLILKSKYKSKNVEVSRVTNLDADIQNYISSNLENQLTQRDSIDLAWIRNNPWILSSPSEKEKNKKYPFSSTAKDFKTWFVKFSMDIQTIGFAYFVFRNGHLKLPYVLFNKDNSKDIVKSIYKILVSQKNVKYFTTFHPHLTKEITCNRNPFLFKKEIKRLFSISKSYPEFNPQELILQDGDGDAIFT